MATEANPAGRLFSVVLTLGLFAATTRSETLEQALHKVTIPNSDDVRGYITLPETLDDFGEGKIKWTSSRPDIVSDRHQGKVAPGIVRRPPPGSQAVNVILTACYVPCDSEDIYQEQARSILAAEDEWEVVSGCITHKMMNTTYAEAPLVVRANPSDPRGKGYYLYADQKWDESPAGDPLEEQLQPYWTKDLISGNWSPIAWTQKPEYDFAKGVIRHGSIIPLTTAEHAAWRRAELITISVTKPPHKTDYVHGESLDLDGLRIEAIYSDGIIDDELHEGYGGYTLSGFDSDMLGTRIVTVSYTVVNVTRTSTFKVDVHKRNH
ncbi:hypothetical protein V490_00885 [Pseudogymnoascus sp. VKM F-3557]|nr:hypothetical protein V490_00885 [Pseudogymnoascus sp. VKM F-3557]